MTTPDPWDQQLHDAAHTIPDTVWDQLIADDGPASPDAVVAATKAADPAWEIDEIVNRVVRVAAPLIADHARAENERLRAELRRARIEASTAIPDTECAQTALHAVMAMRQAIAERDEARDEAERLRARIGEALRICDEWDQPDGVGQLIGWIESALTSTTEES